MEALTAVSLAGTVCQFVDFTSKVLKEGKQISVEGTSLNVKHTSILTGDLKKLLTSLRQCTAACRSTDGAPEGSGPLKSEDQALLDIAHGCEEVITTMLKGLERYPQVAEEQQRKEDLGSKKTDVTGRKAKLSLRSIRAALTLVWGSKHIEEIQDRLNTYRAEISLRLLVFLNASQREHTQTLSRLESSTREVSDKMSEGQQEIVEVLSVQMNTLKLHLDRGRQEYTELAKMSREDAERRHAETIAAFVTHRDGHRSTITPPQTSQSTQTPLRRAVTTDQNFASRTFYAERTGVDATSAASYTDTSSINLKAITDRILNALHFREIEERQAGISTAYDRTLEWIYRDLANYDTSWDPFAEWLESGTGIYWINGKAGSGKSTLMKYIDCHPTTREILDRWRGTDNLIVGSFFFWYAGTSLQRSQVGLLRSLLLFVLRKKAELVPVLFPNIIRALQSGQHDGVLKLTLIELKHALERLVEIGLSTMKVCFIVDGLDEYEGDHDELAALFSSIARSNKVKIIVSSRPIPACVHAFSKCSSLRLQDLTLDDIWSFAQDRLTQHPLMQDLEDETPGATSSLVEAITSKASGVFLWVAVVVKLLMRGLRDYDDIEDLHRKVYDLPEELEDLYSHMFRAMSKADRKQGSKYLQIMLESSRVHGHFPLTPLQLSYAEGEDYTESNLESVNVLSQSAEDRRVEKIEGRLRSRCCGLLEVQRIPGENFLVVSFLHRSVVEFLEDRGTWNNITSWVESQDFTATKALLHSSLAEIKAKLGSPVIEADDGDISAFRAMARLLTFTCTMSGDNGRLCRDVYIPKAMQLFYLAWGRDEHARCRSIPLSNHGQFLFAASQHCTQAELKPLLEVSDGTASPPGMEIITVAEVAAYLLSEFVDERDTSARVAIAKAISLCHANPNICVSIDHAKQAWNLRYSSADYTRNPSDGWTLWEFVLHYMIDLMSSKSGHWLEAGQLSTTFNVIRSLLRDGASPWATISVIEINVGKRKGRNDVFQRKASDLLYAFFWKVWEAETKEPSPRHEQAVAGFFEEICGTNSAFGSVAQKTWQSPPWMRYTRPRNRRVSPEDNNRKGIRAPSKEVQPSKVQGVQKEQRWRTTLPTQRKNLLCEADRNLVEQFCTPELSLRKQRELFAEVMKRDGQVQEQIFSCVEAEKAARKRLQ